MNNIQIIIGGKTLTFGVKFEDDTDAGAPWENSDGHGTVSGWEQRDKMPGELVLNSGRSGKRFYDFAGACKTALAEGWDAAPRNDGTESKRQQAAKAARADFEYLREWCTDQWAYVGVIVTLLDDDGEETEVSDSLWSVENRDGHHEITARDMADELAHGYGTRWGEVTATTFGYLNTAVAA